MFDFANQLSEKYSNFKENSFSERRFSHLLIKSLIEKLKHEKCLEVSGVGFSEELREIYQIQFGDGNTKLMMWSQMHGDEPTATMAIFDILNLLQNPPESIAKTVEKWAEEFSIYFIPFLNPDGAEKFSRFNALGIDLNRDAMACQAKESQLLWELHHKIQPDFAFNLHDQDRFYTVGNSPNPATVSFLTNPIGQNKTTSEQLKSMQLICQMNAVLQEFIPNGVGRYVADFDPTSFGDSFQQTGKCTLLIESGAYEDDWNREIARKMNFIAILSAIWAISEQNLTQFTESDYERIPQNKNRLFDFLIKKAKYNAFGRDIEIDLGINIYEELVDGKLCYSLKLENFGDLQNNEALHNVKVKTLWLEIASQNPREFKNPESIIDALSTAKKIKAISKNFSKNAILERGMPIILTD